MSDLYSSDFSGIADGNLRTQSILDKRQAVQTFNQNLAIQIDNLRSSQKTGDVVGAGLQAAQQFWAGGKIPNQVAALQEHLKAGGTLFSNPVQRFQAAAQDAAKSATASVTSSLSTDVNAPRKYTNIGDGIFESEAAEGAGGVAGTAGKLTGLAMKGLGAATSAVQGGIDIYKDIDSIASGHGIAGDNWASKTSNVLQIGGAIADLGGTVFPPLAVLGGVLDVTAGGFGEAGSVISEKKQEQDDTTLQQQQTETAPASEITTATTGRVS